MKFFASRFTCSIRNSARFSVVAGSHGLPLAVELFGGADVSLATTTSAVLSNHKETIVKFGILGKRAGGSMKASSI